MRLKNYDKENYVSVWVGVCDNVEKYNEYIKNHYDRDDEQSTFELGEDFGIDTYDDTYTLVYFSENATTSIQELLDIGEPEYVIENFKRFYGEKLDKQYNCTIMIYDMKYDGTIKHCQNPKYGEFDFLGSMEADKFDLI